MKLGRLEEKRKEIWMMMLEGHSRKDSERRRKKRNEIDSM
jgi:hypothetical protein